LIQRKLSDEEWNAWSTMTVSPVPAVTFGFSAEDAYAIAEYVYTWFDAGDWGASEAGFLALTIMNPTDVYMQQVLGAIMAKLGRPDEAIDRYTKSIALQPSIASFCNRGEIYLNEGKFEEGLADLRKAMAMDKVGDDPHALRARALAAATVEVIQEVLARKRADREKSGSG
jgi:predicted Zn-dependent protease